MDSLGRLVQKDTTLAFPQASSLELSGEDGNEKLKLTDIKELSSLDVRALGDVSKQLQVAVKSAKEPQSMSMSMCG